MEQSEIFRNEIDQIMSGNKNLSFSALKAFLKSPKHFFAYKIDKDTTKAMNEGKAFHMAILEPEKFKTKYWVLDDSDKVAEIGGAKPRATKPYKEWVADQQSQNADKEQISKEDYELYLKMGNYLYECSATKDLMNGLTEKEKSFEFTYDGFKIKGQIDGEGSDYLLDLKKVADASYDKIRWVIRDMLYDMQGGIYSFAARKKNYYLIFIDKGINVTVVKLSEKALNEGFAKFIGAISEFRRCAEEDAWYSSYEFFNGGHILI